MSTLSADPLIRQFTAHPERFLPPQNTSLHQLDAGLAELEAQKNAWTELSLLERRSILVELLVATQGLGPRWIAASLQARGQQPGSLGEAEEWLFFGSILRGLRLLHQSLIEIERTGAPYVTGWKLDPQNKQAQVSVFPRSLWERLLYRGVSAQVCLEPGLTPAAVVHGQAPLYQANRETGKVCLVLGSGCASMVPAIDALNKLFVAGQVVMLKMSPVNDYLGPLLAEGFGALIRRGFLRLAYGGPETGDYLARHPLVEELHLTGSKETYEAIIYGTGTERELRKTKHYPRLAKPITSELGSISPVIIVPGPWSQKDIYDQARQIVTWLVANDGYSCLTPRLLILARNWPQREAFLSAIQDILAQVPTQLVYYPDARQAYARFLRCHPTAFQPGPVEENHLPWVFIPDLDPTDPNEICFREEPFFGLIAAASLTARDVPDFLDKAVHFANTRLWGTLAATLIVHPKILQSRRISAAMERAISELRYGTVSVNMSPLAAYYLQVTPWGGYPDQDPACIQSGAGKTGNVLMFTGAQKSIVRGPFTRRFDPIRIGGKNSASLCQQLVDFEAAPSLAKAARVVKAALTG